MDKTGTTFPRKPWEAAPRLPLLPGIKTRFIILDTLRLIKALYRDITPDSASASSEGAGTAHGFRWNEGVKNTGTTPFSLYG